MEEKERYVYHEVSNEVETYECYWDNQECCELFDDKAVLNRLNEQDYELKKLNQENIKLIKENRQLKQQLHDLPKKIVEDSKNYKGCYFDWKIGEKIFPAFKITEEDLDTILKKYGGENESKGDVGE